MGNRRASRTAFVQFSNEVTRQVRVVDSQPCEAAVITSCVVVKASPAQEDAAVHIQGVATIDVVRYTVWTCTLPVSCLLWFTLPSLLLQNCKIKLRSLFERYTQAFTPLHVHPSLLQSLQRTLMKAQLHFQPQNFSRPTLFRGNNAHFP